MPLLPRSGRNTWLLALGVWLAAWLAVWRIAPVVPTKTLAFDTPVVNFAFHPDGRTIVTVNVGNGLALNQRTARIHRWDIDSGQPIGDPLDVSNDGAGWLPSRDPRWWSLTLNEGSQPRVRILDVVSWRIETLMEVPRRPGIENQAVFSSDGQLLLIATEAEDTDELNVWDLADRRSRAKIRGASFPADAVRDAGVVVGGAHSPSGNKMLKVFDLDSGRSLRSLPDDQLRFFQNVRIAPSGAFAAATHLSAGSQQTFERPLRCWDLTSGVFHDLTPTVHAGSYEFVGDRVVLVSSDGRDQSLQCFNLSSGDARWSLGLGSTLEPFYFDARDRSPDARLMAMQRVRDRTTSWVYWLIRNGYLSMQKWRRDGFETIVFDDTSGRIVCNLPGAGVRWSPDSRRIMTFGGNGAPITELVMWDVPPRKSLPWLLTGVTLAALPIAFVAWRRARRFDDGR